MACGRGGGDVDGGGGAVCLRPTGKGAQVGNFLCPRCCDPIHCAKQARKQKLRIQRAQREKPSVYYGKVDIHTK